MKQQIIIPIVVALVVGAAAFFGGMKYQQAHAAPNGTAGQFYLSRQGGTRGQNGQRMGRGFGGATVGEIVSTDANSLTIKLQDGSSKIVNLSDSTTYSKTDTASKSDLKTGMRVAAIGTTNSDGSITAQNVQLNPMFRNGRGTSPSPAQ